MDAKRRNSLVDALGSLKTPSVEDDVRAAIARHGAAAVRQAIEKLAKRPRGRRKINDWRELADVVRKDARDWLEGQDPFVLRTNYSIAKAFAEANPGQSAISTHKRIERKLTEKPYDREWHVLVTAFEMSRDQYPYSAHIRTLKHLAVADTHPVWRGLLSDARSAVAEFKKKTGKPPHRHLTMRQIRETPWPPPLSGGPPPAGLFGLLGLLRQSPGEEN